MNKQLISRLPKLCLKGSGSVKQVLGVARNGRSTRLSKSLMLGSMIAAGLLTQSTFANDSTRISLDLSGMSITQHEIAVMQVLSEVCPAILPASQRQRFFRSYDVHLKELLPSIDNPRMALQYLSTQQDYRNVLQSIRTWTLGYSQEENRLLCEDMANSL